ncbi:MAG: hypothetical protein H6866_04500 [Rhodospirillales bacterium]|nr:MAG: hypothetical protein H6866_04500 [Rhodospirillales bacterium]
MVYHYGWISGWHRPVLPAADDAVHVFLFLGRQLGDRSGRGRCVDAPVRAFAFTDRRRGLPGQTAFANWLTLFGVLLRPLLIIMGLIVGTLVFNAGVNFLAATFKYAIFAYNPDATCTLPGTGNAPCGLDIRNVSGFGIITYTVLFVYLVYMLANSCFKLIDAIPDKMLRWLGGGSSFTGDRPVDIGNMQGMALAGYAVMTQGHSALEGTEKNFRATNARRRDIKEKENEIRRLHGDVNAPSSGGMT